MLENSNGGLRVHVITLHVTYTYLDINDPSNLYIENQNGT